MGAASTTKKFWDRAASNDPAWYTATAFTAENEAFFKSGQRDADVFLDLAGVPLEPSMIVLEIGCGTGRMTKYLASRARQVIATDVSAGMLEHARANLPGVENIDFVELAGDGSLPLADASVNAVLSYITMKHVSTTMAQEAYFASAIRVLADGGWALLQFRRSDARNRTRDLVANIRNAARGKHTLSSAWRGAVIDESRLRAMRTEHVSIDILRLDTRHIWALVRKRAVAAPSAT